MLRKASKAVHEGNGLVPQKKKPESGQLTMGDVYRLLVERLDRQLEIMDSHFNEISEETSKMDQRLTRLEHGARQPRLATEADGQQADNKTRERTKGAATAVQAMRGDCFSDAGLNPAQPPTRPVSA